MNTSRRHIALLIILTILGLIGAGCSTYSGTAPSTAQVTLSVVPTMTVTMLATLAPQITPTQRAPFQIDSSCWQIKQLQGGNDIPGSLLFDYGYSGIFYWDVSSFQAKLFTKNISEWGLFLSSETLPSDRKSVPLIGSDGKVLFTSSDHSSISFSFPHGNYGIKHLLNGNIFYQDYGDVIGRPVDTSIYQEGVGYTDQYYIYDSKTGEQIESHSVFLPKFTYYAAGQLSKADISYSPDGNYVLYRSTLLDGKDGFSLLDLHSNQVKWTVPVSNKELGGGDQLPYMPIWKPDGSALTFIWASEDENKAQNFYTISLDGIVTQFTRFEEAFPHGYILDFSPQWSPDRHYMAFRVQKPDHPMEFELLIWDDVSKTLLDPCLPVDGIEPYYGVDWSFDSKHIVLDLPYPAMPSPRLRHWMLDVPNKILYELPGDEAMQNYLGQSGKVTGYSTGFWMNWEIP